MASFGDESPSKLSRVPNTALSCSLWGARPWPSNSFKRMVTAVPQEPMACALSDEWLQRLFMHHEFWSNLTAGIGFSDVCHFSCKHVQRARPKETVVFSLLLDQSFGDRGPKDSPQSLSIHLKQRECIGWRWTWNRSRIETESPRHKCRFSYLTWQHRELIPTAASEMNPQHSAYRFHCG